MDITKGGKKEHLEKERKVETSSERGRENLRKFGESG